MRFLLVSVVVASLLSVACKPRAYNSGSAAKSVEVQNADQYDDQNVQTINANQVEIKVQSIFFLRSIKQGSAWKKEALNGKDVYSLQLTKDGSSRMKCEPLTEYGSEKYVCLINFTQAKEGIVGERCKEAHYPAQPENQYEQGAKAYCDQSLKAFDPKTGGYILANRIAFTGEEAITLYNSLNFNAHESYSGIVRPGQPWPTDNQEKHSNEWILCGELQANNNIIECRI